jgi:hypothetical protein
MSESHMNLRLKDLARSHTWMILQQSSSHSGSWLRYFSSFSPPKTTSCASSAKFYPCNLCFFPTLSVHLMHPPGCPMQRSDVSYCSIASHSNPHLRPRPPLKIYSCRMRLCDDTTLVTLLYAPFLSAQRQAAAESPIPLLYDSLNRWGQ